jgi:antitoxin PrlF
MKINRKGQVTIPKALREALGLRPQSEVDFIREGDRVYLRKATTLANRGARLVAAWQGKASVKLSTDELMALTRSE